MIGKLAERVDSSLRNLGDSLWLPELTTELVEAGWRDLYCTAGLLPDSYGTARVIARDASAPRRIIACVPMISGADCLIRELQVEILDRVFTRRYKQADVDLYTAQDLGALDVSVRLKEALNVLKHIPSLFTTVVTLVRIIHVLDPRDDEYDVSFSEPHIPFSIFTSIPRRSDINSPLRLAEAIVHEAMHLQLTLIEQDAPLVVESGLNYLSPWRREFRASGGVLHALYVFRVIDAFLTKLLACASLAEGCLDYVRDRRDQIARQMDEIKSFRQCPELTPLGTAFVSHLLNYDCIKPGSRSGNRLPLS